MSNSFLCHIPFRSATGTNQDRDWAWELFQSIATNLNCRDTANMRKYYLADGFSLSFNDNKHDVVPRYYFENDIRTWYFNFCIDYYSEHFDLETDSSRVAEILNSFWEKKIPAAVMSYSEDFDYALPFKGGNDWDFMFWKDEVQEL